MPSDRVAEIAAGDGRCQNCGEDEMDGARCYYCGFHEYDCEMPDCEWRNHLQTKGNDHAQG